MIIATRGIIVIPAYEPTPLLADLVVEGARRAA